jgi:hypothetical protein
MRPGIQILADQASIYEIEGPSIPLALETYLGMCFAKIGLDAALTPHKDDIFFTFSMQLHDNSSDPHR